MSDPIVSATPDALILNPGESAQVTIAADPDSPSGIGGVSITVEVPPQYTYLIEGDTALTIGPGETGHITGDVNLTGDLVNEGFLTGIDTFIVEGNGFQILGQNGGRFDLAGKQKSAWVRWGDPVVGWEVGDRLAVAPTAIGVYVPSEIVWGGDWTSTARPANSPDVTLLDGRIARPEVTNLSQTITLQNLARFHFHDTAVVQTLRYLKVLNSGVAGLLGHYAVHFHLLGEGARGSLVEGVVVEGAKFRSFVPHASHGITFRDAVSYNSADDGFWWDGPAVRGSITNESNDIAYEHCLVLSPLGGQAFSLTSGLRNRIVDSAAAGGSKMGIFWDHEGRNVWEVERNVVHNLISDQGVVRSWQNDFEVHHTNDLTIYNCGPIAIAHGAYNSVFQYSNLLIQGSATTVQLAANGRNAGPPKYTDVLTDGELLVVPHKASPGGWADITRATFTRVRYSESISSGDAGSKLRFIDCGLTPADFVFTKVHPTTLIEVVEGGVLLHSWAAGVWS